MGQYRIRKRGDGMIVTLEEAKTYLRVDYADDDALLEGLLSTAHKLCMDVARISEEEFSGEAESGRAAVLYTVAYLYEHREEAEHHELMLTLRSLLFGIRREGF